MPTCHIREWVSTVSTGSMVITKLTCVHYLNICKGTDGLTGKTIEGNHYPLLQSVH